MSLIGNILWIVFAGGLITCIQYLIAGLILCITIIFLPFGLQCFKLAELALFPFGRDVVETPNAGGILALIAGLIWLLLAGIWIALTHIICAIGCAITIIGLPFALQHLKLARLGLFPFGKGIH